MIGLPTACTSCRRPFSSDRKDARLAHIEQNQALCDRCVWLVEHPESRGADPREESARAA